MPTPARFSHADAKRFYDWLGRGQDTQRWYEDRAVAALVSACRLAEARRVGEFGCGTGRLAARLLQGTLPPEATYVGFDISETMVALARQALAPWSERARVARTAGPPVLPVGDGAFDRLLTVYVLDLLDESDTQLFFAEAHRVLGPGGLLGIVSLTCPDHGAAGVVARVWGRVRDRFPALVGGCRPVSLAPHLAPGRWRIHYRETVVQMLVSSEVIVAESIGAQGEAGLKSVHVTITGRVQGIGYRAWVDDEAMKRGLAGWVRNRRDGSVEAVFSGEAEAVTAMIAACNRGPLGARVTSVIASDYVGPPLTRFTVLPTE